MSRVKTGAVFLLELLITVKKKKIIVVKPPTLRILKTISHSHVDLTTMVPPPPRIFEHFPGTIDGPSPTPQYSRSYFSANPVVVLVHGRDGRQLAGHRVVVRVGRRHRRLVVTAGPLRRAPGGRHRVLRLDELSGELDAPPDVVVASAPLERAVGAVRVRAASAARRHAGRAVPGHGVRERGRAERVHQRLFSSTCGAGFRCSRFVICIL